MIMNVSFPCHGVQNLSTLEQGEEVEARGEVGRRGKWLQAKAKVLKALALECFYTQGSFIGIFSAAK